MEMCWSKSRVQRFVRCRREYFLHHFAAPAGIMTGAGRDLRLAAELKKLVTLDHYLYRLLREVLHREPASGGGIDSVAAELYRRWGVDRRFARVSFYEEYYGILAPDELAGRGAAALERMVGALANSELAELIAPAEDRRFQPLTTPLAFVLGDTTIYLAPFAMLYTNSHYYMMELGGHRLADVAAMQLFYAHTFRRIPPHAFTCMFYHLDGRCSIFGAEEIDFTATVQAVSRESEEMARAFAPEIIANNAYSGVPANRTACAECAYRKLCLQDYR